MIYRFNISTAANTLETAKQRTVLQVVPGVVHLLEILFPPGPQGYLHLAINQGLNQVWPTNPDADFASDDNLIRFREFYEVFSKPAQFTAYTWNLDDTYSHSVIIRIGVLKKSIIAPWLMTWKDKLAGFVIGYE